MTEFGWATQNTTQYYEYGNQISYEMQADYLVRAVQYARTYYGSWLTGMFVWNLNFAIPWNAEKIRSTNKHHLVCSMATGARGQPILH